MRGVYDSVGDAEADYQRVKDLHAEAGLIDAYDAAVIERREDGKPKVVKKHETPTPRLRLRSITHDFQHAGQHRSSDGAPFIEHPLEVGWLLSRTGEPDDVIAAGG